MPRHAPRTMGPHLAACLSPSPAAAGRRLLPLRRQRRPSRHPPFPPLHPTPLCCRTSCACMPDRASTASMDWGRSCSRSGCRPDAAWAAAASASATRQAKQGVRQRQGGGAVLRVRHRCCSGCVSAAVLAVRSCQTDGLLCSAGDSWAPFGCCAPLPPALLGCLLPGCRLLCTPAPTYIAQTHSTARRGRG